MSSGFGLRGGRGRCFPHWQEFTKCYGSADHPDDCKLQFEDYQECLFHRKEAARLTLVREMLERKKVAEKAAEKAAAGGK